MGYEHKKYLQTLRVGYGPTGWVTDTQSGLQTKGGLRIHRSGYEYTGRVTDTQGGLRTHRVGYEYTGWVTDSQGGLQINRVVSEHMVGYRPTG